MSEREKGKKGKKGKREKERKKEKKKKKKKKKKKIHPGWIWKALVPIDETALTFFLVG